MKNLKISILVAFSIFVGFFSAVSISQIEIKPLKIEEKNVTINQDEFLSNVISIVKKEYVEEKTDRQLVESAANGILTSLDPHSQYLNEDGFKEIQTQTRGEFGGLGIEITSEFSVIKVISAIEDTPAFKADVKSGDYITKVNDKSIAGISLEEVVKKLRGKPGTQVKITILRKGEKAPLEKTITRQIIKIKAVRSAKFGDIAYIKINTFSEQAYFGVTTELKKLKRQIGEQNIKGIALDLRNNPGGLLEQAVKVSDLFLNKDQLIVAIKGRDKVNDKEYRDESDEDLTKGIPVAILINEGSASASEIVAGALQDNRRAVIVGNKSFGKGSVQTVIPLKKNNGALRLTTSLYYTPSGRSIQAQGIDPDIVVTSAKIEKQVKIDADSEADLENHIKAQLQEAAAEAKQQIKDDNLDLYETDYQLARTIDLLRGINVYKSAVPK